MAARVLCAHDGKLPRCGLERHIFHARGLGVEKNRNTRLRKALHRTHAHAASDDSVSSGIGENAHRAQASAAFVRRIVDNRDVLDFAIPVISTMVKQSLWPKCAERTASSPPSPIEGIASFISPPAFFFIG